MMPRMTRKIAMNALLRKLPEAFRHEYGMTNMVRGEGMHILMVEEDGLYGESE